MLNRLMIFLESQASSSVGTIAYWPPERCVPQSTTEHHYDVRSDIWSLGITLAEVACGKLPYFFLSALDYNSVPKMMDMIVNVDSKKIVHQYFVNYSDFAKQFLTNCLEEVNRRPSNYKMFLESNFYKRYRFYAHPEEIAGFIRDLSEVIDVFL